MMPFEQLDANPIGIQALVIADSARNHSIDSIKKKLS